MKPTAASSPILVTALLACAGSASAIPVPGMGTWETTLQPRDINGDGMVDAYFDTVRSITWLADVKYGAGSTFDDGANPGDGRMSFANAATWVAALDVHGVTGWRFGSEVDSLFYTTLGNSGVALTAQSGWYNTGPFANAVDIPPNSGWYWLGAPPSEDPACAPDCPMVSKVFWADGVGSGYYDIHVTSAMSVWAVRDGDVPVAAVPELQTWVAMLGGLAVLVWLAERRPASLGTSARVVPRGNGRAEARGRCA